MTTDKLKELREWGTFWLSATAVVAIPIGLLVLNNQRMQIERAVSDGFISKAAYLDDKARSEKETDETRSKVDKNSQDSWRKLAEFGVKQDELLQKQIRLEDSMLSLKESFTSFREAIIRKTGG